MAGLGPGPCRSGEVAGVLDKTTAQAGSVRDALIKRGLIYSPRWGQLAFTVPMFDEYVNRSALRSSSEEGQDFVMDAAVGGDA